MMVGLWGIARLSHAMFCSSYLLVQMTVVWCISIKMSTPLPTSALGIYNSVTPALECLNLYLARVFRIDRSASSIRLYLKAQFVVINVQEMVDVGFLFRVKLLNILLVSLI